MFSQKLCLIMCIVDHVLMVAYALTGLDLHLLLVTTCYVFHLEGAGKQCLGDGFQAFVNVN